MSRIDRKMLARADRSDWRGKKAKQERRKRKPMSLEEREKFLTEIIAELSEKARGFHDPGAIAFTKRVIAESERDLKIVQEQIKAKGGRA